MCASYKVSMSFDCPTGRAKWTFTVITLVEDVAGRKCLMNP